MMRTSSMFKPSRRFLSTICLVLSTICACALCAQVLASDKQYRFHLVSTSGDADSPNGKSVQAFSDRVWENSSGRIKINVFHQNELGGQGELFDQLLKGNVHFMLEWPLTSYDSRLALGMVPYLVVSWEDAFQAYAEDGWLRNILAPIFEENNLHFFGAYPEGFGGIATRDRYATTIEGARGLKVRSQTIFPLPQTTQVMGYEAVPIDWSEVYTSIQTGVVDGDSSNVIYWDYQYFGDLLDYYVHTRHVFASAVFVMNDDAWNSLDEEDQTIISEAANWMSQEQFKNARSTDEYWIRTAQENGMEYIELNSEEMRDMVNRVRAEMWPIAEESFGSEIMNQIKANATILD